MKPRTCVHQTRSRRTSADPAKITEAETLLGSWQSWRKSASCKAPILFNSGNGVPEHNVPQILQQYDTVGLTTASKKRLIIHGKGFVAMELLVFCCQTRQSPPPPPPPPPPPTPPPPPPLPFWSSLFKADCQISQMSGPDTCKTPRQEDGCCQRAMCESRELLVFVSHYSGCPCSIRPRHPGVFVVISHRWLNGRGESLSALLLAIHTESYILKYASPH